MTSLDMRNSSAQETLAYSMCRRRREKDAWKGVVNVALRDISAAWNYGGNITFSPNTSQPAQCDHCHCNAAATVLASLLALAALYGNSDSCAQHGIPMKHARRHVTRTQCRFQRLLCACCWRRNDILHERE